MSDFQLGQRVAYSTQLKRRFNDGTARRLGEVPQRQWTTIAYGDTPLRGGEGVVIGKRTLSNGNVIRAYYEGGGDEYIPSEHFTAYLIAYDLRRKPVHVLPEHVTALDEEPEHCPYDCDSCHGADCPCDRLGCEGSEQGVLA